jgi:ABC-type branched-subunit amino acid transport system substrate-binding protein
VGSGAGDAPGGLIPIARQYPGAREFAESYKKEFSGANLSYRSAAGYAGCQILLEAVKRAGSLESEKVRDAILKMDLHTVFGAFKVDRDGSQIAHKVLMFQWQDGKKAVVWPEELAPVKARFPTPLYPGGREHRRDKGPLDETSPSPQSRPPA